MKILKGCGEVSEEMLKSWKNHFTDSLMSEKAINMTIQAQLTLELEKVSSLKANVTALYQEGEKLCTGRISNKGNCNLLKYTT